MTATPAALSELDPATLLDDPAAFETALDERGIETPEYPPIHGTANQSNQSA